jgi:hypothetical protein
MFDAHQRRLAGESRAARHWREVRAEAIAQGRVPPARVDSGRKAMSDSVQAQRLADIRKTHDDARQADVAALMGSPRRVYPSWKAATCRTELGTLRLYVAALGGNLRIATDFGESIVELTARRECSHLAC